MNIFLEWIFIFSTVSSSNVTYLLSPVSSIYLENYLNLNNSILNDSSSVQRLSSSTDELISSLDILSMITNHDSIVFNSDDADCSLSTALAFHYNSCDVSTPICFSVFSSPPSNLYRLTVNSEQIALAAKLFMNQYSLIYFSILLTDSNDFYLKFSQSFSSYLTKNAFILEQTVFINNFSSASVTNQNSKGKKKRKRLALNFFSFSLFRYLFL